MVFCLFNSNAGFVTVVYDVMKSYNFFIVSLKMPISHILLSKTRIGIENIKEYIPMSRPQHKKRSTMYVFWELI